MIKMISFANFDSFDKALNDSPDAAEQDAAGADFTAMLGAFAAPIVPLNPQTQFSDANVPETNALQIKNGVPENINPFFFDAQNEFSKKPFDENSNVQPLGEIFNFKDEIANMNSALSDESPLISKIAGDGFQQLAPAENRAAESAELNIVQKPLSPQNSEPEILAEHGAENDLPQTADAIANDSQSSGSAYENQQNTSENSARDQSFAETANVSKRAGDSPPKPPEKTEIREKSDSGKTFETGAEIRDLDVKTEKYFQIENIALPEKPAKKTAPLLREITAFLNIETAKTAASGETVSQTAADAPRAGTVDLTEQIKPHFFELAKAVETSGDKKILQFRLRPAEFGMIEIRLERDADGKLAAHFQTENDAVREILTENLDRLRESLQNSGWQIERLDVSVNSFGSGGQQSRENSSRQVETVENPKIFDADNEDKDESEQSSRTRLVSLRA